jgi:hypothetical protein
MATSLMVEEAGEPGENHQSKSYIIPFAFQYFNGLPNNSYKLITNMAWVRARLCKLQKGCTGPAAASDKVTSCLSMIGGSLRVLRLLSPLKLVYITR